MDSELNRTMDGQMPTPPNIVQIKQSPKKGLLFEIIFVIVFLVILFGILNYFNILRLSEIFPNQLGFLPHRAYEQPNIPTVSPTQQAKEAFVQILPTILAPSFLPKPSDIAITQTKGIKESFSASWNTKEGTGATAVLVMSSEGNNISQIHLSFLSPQTTSVSAELAQTVLPQYFSLQPKGKWGCSPLYGTTLYCENFWDERDSKRGLGFLMDTASKGSKVIFSFCEHAKNSSLYSWKSCRAEFAKSGVK